MTPTKHTPGPWAVEPLEADCGRSIAIVSADPTRGGIVAIIPPDERCPDDADWNTATRQPEDMANAHLIASAPRLLESDARLEAMLPLFEEARGALCAISTTSMRLHGISPTLADRMDVVGIPERWHAWLNAGSHGDESERPQSPTVFSPDRALEACLRIHDTLYLETDEQTDEPIYNPEKEWTIDMLQSITDDLAEVVQRPASQDGGQ